jgi:hypothetical protein
MLRAFSFIIDGADVAETTSRKGIARGNEAKFYIEQLAMQN